VNRIGIKLTIGLLAGFWALGAAATPIQVAFDGFANGSQSGTIYGVRTAGVAAGQFDFDVIDDGGVYWDDTLQAFCIDVTTNLITSGTAQYNLISASSSGRLSALQLSLIGGLYDQHAGSLGNASNDAAFHLALWEIIYNPTSLQLTSGSFYTSPFWTSRSLAQSWLSGLVGDGSYASTSYEFFVLESPNNNRGRDINQSLLLARAVPVPEPGTLALLGVGLLAMGAMRRRQRA
jgi:hypothetical protein